MAGEEYADYGCMANDICVRFGRRLRRVRNQKGVKQEQLSQRTGIARTYIPQIENGRQEICLRRLEELAIGLDIPLSQLFKGV